MNFKKLLVYALLLLVKTMKFISRLLVFLWVKKNFLFFLYIIKFLYFNQIKRYILSNIVQKGTKKRKKATTTTKLRFWKQSKYQANLKPTTIATTANLAIITIVLITIITLITVIIILITIITIIITTITNPTIKLIIITNLTIASTIIKRRKITT
jgi:hypothetical protein